MWFAAVRVWRSAHHRLRIMPRSSEENWVHHFRGHAEPQTGNSDRDDLGEVGPCELAVKSNRGLVVCSGRILGGVIRPEVVVAARVFGLCDPPARPGPDHTPEPAGVPRVHRVRLVLGPGGESKVFTSVVETITVHMIDLPPSGSVEYLAVH